MTLTDLRLEAFKYALTQSIPGQKQWAAIDQNGVPPVNEFASRPDAEAHIDEHGGQLYRRLGHGLAWEAVA
ncbi:hypothetical protein IU500_12355 [Nocardia terpenica]|uniref:hypothetical protein n=1 Tax=Nocardia terpenica TaxID=455432 RepID=UPI00189553CC|nr:hypothetical protein [Nocardia terpenica]MBF6063031.1 hypothetical protein [Nocardia terpenica]MBF6104834.1 hypothetical protein [Nocardia terpenica]MBF6112730.1 hypothetical protein [Nocardia terpenica]MBF6118562.1 hypothetical protein [Nocardia terpenica]MBF6155041.1 hypothetical protein [Nocardia terpenica]